MSANAVQPPGSKRNHSAPIACDPQVRRAGMLLLGALIAHNPAQAEAVSDVETRLQEQDQRIRVLERKLELAQEASSAAASTTPTIKASSNGFSISSADGQNTLRIRGTVNLDGRYFGRYDASANLTNNIAGSSAYQSANGFLLRKVRPYLEGTLGGLYDWRLQPEFGGGRSVMLDSYVAARFKPWAVVTIGKFKTPIGLERLQTEQFNKFVELGLPSSLVPNRDVGLQWAGNLHQGTVSYALAMVNGVADGSSSENNPSADADSDGKAEWVARVFTQPFANSNQFRLRGLGFGIAVSSGSVHGNAEVSTRGTSFSNTTQIVPVVTTNTWLPSIRSNPQQVMFSYRGDNADTLTANEASFADGRHTRLAPQAYYYYGSLGLLSEYVRVRQAVSRHVNSTSTRSDTLTHQAWQVAASYFFTGEEASYNSVTPLRPFALGKPGFGALELAARYQRLIIDADAFTGGAQSYANPLTAVRAATGYGLALNWYLNQPVRVTVEYDLTRFTGGAGSTNVTDRTAESAWLARVAIAF